MSDQEIIDDLLERLKERNIDEYQHSIRVGELAKRFVKEFKLNLEEEAAIYTAALLHDIGILEISEDLVEKATRLTFDEYEEVKSHILKAEPLIKDLSNFEKVMPLIKYHHENFNGFGYLGEVEGTKIPLGARIIHVLEAYDSMINPRPYQKYKFDKERAIKELRDFASRIYDPDVVKKFVKILSETE